MSEAKCTRKLVWMSNKQNIEYSNADNAVMS